MINPNNPLPPEFDALRVAIDAIAAGIFVSVVAMGAPGIGKTYTAESHLKAKHPTLPYAIFRNATMPAVVAELYKWRDGGLLILDDADELFVSADVAGINLLKSALDQKDPLSRQISRFTMSTALNKIPNDFATKVKLLVLSNNDLTDPAAYASSVRTLVPSLRSRPNRWLRFTNDRTYLLDYVTHLVADKKILKTKNFGDHRAKYVSRQTEADVLAFFTANVSALQEVSVRAFENLIRLALATPNWQAENEKELIGYVPPPVMSAARPPLASRVV